MFTARRIVAMLAFTSAAMLSTATGASADGYTAEDGTHVPSSYYSQTAGPTPAVCEHLGKRWVATDDMYGSRCV